MKRLTEKYGSGRILKSTESWAITQALSRLQSIEDILGEDYDLEGLRALIDQASEVQLRWRPGDAVWVVERNEDGMAVDIAGYCFICFIATACGYVIVAPAVDGSKAIVDIMEHAVAETNYCWGTDSFAVFPARDCYTTQDAALEAYETMKKEESRPHG